MEKDIEERTIEDEEVQFLPEPPSSRTSSRTSLRSNMSGLVLRTGKTSNMDNNSRPSTPKTVIPPINRTNSEMDRSPGEGEAFPKIVRNFRRETTPDTSGSKTIKRTVSFVQNDSPAQQSLETQTDWDWLEDAMLDGSVKIIEPKKKVDQSDSDESNDQLEKVAVLDSPSQSVKDTEVDTPDQSMEEGPMPYPYSNDEYGIPILDLSSDTDDSSDEESRRSSKREVKLLPSVGPPPILKYVRESEQEDLNSMKVEVGDLNIEDYPQDAEGNIHGYFSGNCEFCQKPIKPFPTTEQQQQQPPEELFCCEEYRKFIEFTIEGDSAGQPSQSLIDVRPHPHYGSKQARKMAQQKAHQRMRERELLRQQQTAALQSSGHPANHPQRPTKNFQAAVFKEGLIKGTKTNISGGSEGGSADKPALAALNFFAPAHKGMPLITTAADGDAPDGGEKAPVAPAPTSIRDRSDVESVPIKKEKKPALAISGDLKNKDSDLSQNSSSEVARQMKTINYQLSSQRCLEEGWTVRPPSPLLVTETDDVFIPEPLDSAFTEGRKVRKRELVQKFYEDGQPFITIFPDGSGNVFYPSGYVAIVISRKELGQYTYLVLDDNIEPCSEKPFGVPPQVLGYFCSNGQASCSYTTGSLRLFLDQYGGIELDREGAKKRRWHWNDMETHVHAPPFQPVCFSLSPFMAVRVMTQENISLTFRSRNRSCRFPVGAKLKLVAPENIPPKVIDNTMLYINETKTKTETLLNKISNLLRFPNSPKVDKMLPPLHITSKIHKNQKLRQEQAATMAAVQAKANKPRPIRPVVVN